MMRRARRHDALAGDIDSACCLTSSDYPESGVIPIPRTFDRAVIADETLEPSCGLAKDFAESGFECRYVQSFCELAECMRSHDSALVVCEVRLRDGTVYDFLESLPRELRRHVVVLTSYGSIASAVYAIKLGASGYLSKPATASQILAAVRMTATVRNIDVGHSAPLTLDRSIWEVLNQAVIDEGTISGAARRLGLQPRSLRRMLSKYPPPR